MVELISGNNGGDMTSASDNEGDMVTLTLSHVSGPHSQNMSECYSYGYFISGRGATGVVEYLCIQEGRKLYPHTQHSCAHLTKNLFRNFVSSKLSKCWALYLIVHTVS